jgi:hypothetical protein
MRVVTFKKGNRWGYRIMIGRDGVVAKGRRLYASPGEAATVGKNHKQAITARVSPTTGKPLR